MSGCHSPPCVGKLAKADLVSPSQVTGARPFYDLTNPVIYQRDEAVVKEGAETKEKGIVAVVRRTGSCWLSGDLYSLAG